MTYDELRKKAFDLECHLGESMKLCDMMRNELLKAQQYTGKLTDINAAFVYGIQKYLDTMDKNVLLRCIDDAKNIAKNLYPK